jgi:hypothetical protein
MARLIWTVIAVDGAGQGHGTCGHEHATADEATLCPWDPERPVVCDLLVRQVRADDGRRRRGSAQLAMPWGGHRLRQRGEQRRAA